MGAKEFSSVFSRGVFRKKFLEDIGWQENDLHDFRKNLEEGFYKPEALFLDLFVNAFTGTPTANEEYRNFIWWRGAIQIMQP